MDVELHYREQGSGETLILLHGNGEDGSYFEHQMSAFAPRFRVIALDTRGHGKSPRGKAPFTIRQFADDLLAFMDERGSPAQFSTPAEWAKIYESDTRLVTDILNAQQ